MMPVDEGVIGSLVVGCWVCNIKKWSRSVFLHRTEAIFSSSNMLRETNFTPLVVVPARRSGHGGVPMALNDLLR